MLQAKHGCCVPRQKKMHGDPVADVAKSAVRQRMSVTFFLAIDESASVHHDQLQNVATPDL